MKLDNPIYVMMPVKCIGKICKDCPNLNIDTDVSEIYANGDKHYETDLRCRGVSRCLRIYNMMEDKHENDTNK